MVMRGTAPKVGLAVLAAAIALTLIWLPGTGSTQTGDDGAKGVLLASSKTLPDGRFEDFAVLVSGRRALRRTWNQFDLEGHPPIVDFERRRVLFAGTGEGSSCPLEYRSLERVQGRRLVKVHAETKWGPICTDDFTPRTFVVAAKKSNFPQGKFDVKTGHGRKVEVRRR